jgi:hypothetical protein
VAPNKSIKILSREQNGYFFDARNRLARFTFFLRDVTPRGARWQTGQK